jgi:hypothetical protein
MEAALMAMVDTINATGGVVKSDSGTDGPVADEELLDLGDAYITACKALGLEPMIASRTCLRRFRRQPAVLSSTSGRHRPFPVSP